MLRGPAAATGPADGECGGEKRIVTTVSPDCAGLAVIDTDVTGLRGLVACVARLQSSHLDAADAEIAFRSRIARARSSTS